MARSAPRVPDVSDELDQNSRWTIPVVLGLGLVSLAMLLGNDWIHGHLVLRRVAVTEAVAETRTALASSHLWLEELFSGHDVDPAMVMTLYSQALHRIRRIAGDEIPAASWVAEPDLAARARGLARRVEDFGRAARHRLDDFRRGEASDTHGAIDSSYDRRFSALELDLSSLQVVLEDRRQRAQAGADFLVQMLTVLWVGGVLLTAIALRRREDRRRRMAAALRDSQRQLAQAQKMEALGRLAGGMAHDINNYLAAVLAQCELTARHSERSSEVQRRMQTVVETLGRASSLIGRVLAFSRRQPSRPEVVNLNRLLEGLSGLLGRLLGEDLQLGLQLEPHLWNCRIDPAQAEQIVLNLVINAREAMERGGSVTLATGNRQFHADELSGAPVDRPGDYVMLAVSDTGPGVDPAIHDRIFEPFATTRREAGNSGLGLSTVYGIVRQHRGHLWLQSEPGIGTAFKLYFPRCREPETAVAEAEPEARALPATFPQGATVLLVEDNDDLRRSMEEALASLGIRVVSAASSAAALHSAERLGGRIDLLLTDVVLPDSNGPELAARLARQHESLRVLYVSGYAESVLLRHGLASREVDLLAKPFALEQLQTRVRDALASDRNPPPVARRPAAGEIDATDSPSRAS